MTSSSLSGALAHGWYSVNVNVDKLDEGKGDDEPFPVRRLGTPLVPGGNG